MATPIRNKRLRNYLAKYAKTYSSVHIPDKVFNYLPDKLLIQFTAAMDQIQVHRVKKYLEKNNLVSLKTRQIKKWGVERPQHAHRHIIEKAGVVPPEYPRVYPKEALRKMETVVDNKSAAIKKPLGRAIRKLVEFYVRNEGMNLINLSTFLLKNETNPKYPPRSRAILTRMRKITQNLLIDYQLNKGEMPETWSTFFRYDMALLIEELEATY